MQEQHGPNWGIGIAAKQDLLVRQARDKTMAEANRRAFVAECEASGVDPSEGVSPSLRHIIEDRTPRALRQFRTRNKRHEGERGVQAVSVIGQQGAGK
jgi:hypothetical protein